MNDVIENWKNVVGYEGLYQVSDLGRVRSLDRPRDGRKTTRGKILTLSMASDYARVGLRDAGGRTKTIYAHHLVLLAFVGSRPAGMDACHGPLGASCNAASNLRWGSRKSNLADRQCCGFLSQDDVRAIRVRLSKYRHGLFAELAREFGVEDGTISNIYHGKTWSWIM